MFMLISTFDLFPHHMMLLHHIRVVQLVERGAFIPNALG